MKKLDKRQIEYMARAIIPELYERQADTDGIYIRSNGSVIKWG